jgi:hypothetical protein
MEPGPKFPGMIVLGLSALLVFVGALALAACGSSTTTQPDATSTPGAAATAAAGSLGGGPTRGVPVTALDMDPRNPSVLYAATTEGLFKSSDGAESWSRLPGTFRGIYSTAAVDPMAPSTIYAIGPRDDGVPARRLQRSDDGGATWVNLSDAGSPQIEGYEAFVWFDATVTPSTVYAWGVKGGDLHVYRSSDRGETWTRDPSEKQDPPWDTSAVPRRMSSAAQKALDAFMASFGQGAWITVGGGASRLMLNVTGSRPLVDPRDPSVFYAGTVKGVYKSLDGGKTWTQASAGLGATKGEGP